jgi:peroxiredoxin 2/4
MSKFLFTLLLLSIVSIVNAQKQTGNTVLQIGNLAPSFTALSTNGEINFPSDYGRKWKVLFSHPADFTPVCSSELLELAQLQEGFNKLNTSVVVISTDQLETHKSWKESMESIQYKGRDPVKINFPLIDDHTLQAAKMYGMIQDKSNPRKDVRGVFILDPDDVVQAIFYYPMNIGRNIEEIKRTVEALQTSRKDMVLTPANWKPGEDVMISHVNSEDQKVSLASQSSPDLYEVSWYMIFKKSK